MVVPVSCWPALHHMDDHPRPTDSPNPTEPRDHSTDGGGTLRLSLRTYQRQLESGKEGVEANFHYEEWPIAIPVHQAALVLVDVWDTHYIRSHAARTAEIART